MKIKYGFLTILISVFVLSLGTACSSDNDNPDPTPPKEEPAPELEVDKNKIEVVIGKYELVEITSGGGDYSAYAKNETIATISLFGSSVAVTGVALGETSVVIYDQNDKDQTILVKVIEEPQEPEEPENPESPVE